MKKCPNCGAHIDDNSQFCTECGKSIPQGYVCSHCGALVSNDDVFCQNCGSKVEGDSGQRASSATAPEQKHCPHCGTAVSIGSVFCENCGRNMVDGSSVSNMNFQNQMYNETESSSQNKIVIPIVIGLFVLALAGGGWWYYNSYKPKMNGLVVDLNNNDSIANEQEVFEENVDSFEATTAVSATIDEVIADTIVDDSQYSDVAMKERSEDFAAKETASSKTAIREYENRQSQQSDNKVYEKVEQMPSFPGGEAALMRYLSSNVHYPVVAEENGVQGKVFLTFVIERDGSITDVKVVKSVDPALDKEAVRVIKNMPQWRAGTQDGKPVCVKITMPIIFRLE